MLIELLSHDNEIRKAAELQLDSLRQNVPALVHCISKVLLNSTDKGVKTLASVILRRLLDIKENETVSSGWTVLSPDFKEQVKRDILQTVLSEPDKKQKIKFCDTMATITENVFEANETWVELPNFIFNTLSLSLEPENIPLIEANLFFISQIFSYIYEEMIKHLDTFITAFSSYFRQDNLDLKTRTVQVIGEILCVVKKKDSKRFKEFIPMMLETAYKCLSDPTQENNVLHFF